MRIILGVLFATQLVPAAEMWRQIIRGLPVSGVGAQTLIADPIDPSTLYGISYTGLLFKSTDGSGSWQALSGATGVTSLITDPDYPATLYAGTSHGVLKSTDGGLTWTGANAGLTNATGGARVLAFDPFNSSTLYAVGNAIFQSTQNNDIFKSVDGGKNWTPLNSRFYVFEGAQTPLAMEFVSRLIIDPARPSTMYSLASGTMGGAFKTTDGGTTWYGLPGARNVGGFYALALDPATSTLYVAGNDLSPKGHITSSTDQGATWTAADAGFPNAVVLGLAIDPRNAGTVYAWYAQPGNPNSYGFAKSTDTGKSWTTVNNGLSVNYSFRALTVTANSDVYASFQNSFTFYNNHGYWGGIFKSTDGGASWHGANAGPAIVDVPAVAADPANPDVLYAAADYEGVFKSTDGGENWAGLGAFQYPQNQFGQIPLNATSLAIAAGSGVVYAWASCLLFESIDAGGSWLHDPNLQPHCSTDGYVFADPHDPSVAYSAISDFAEGSSGLSKTTDGGISWRNVWSSSGVFFNSMAINPADSATIYAGTSGGLLKSPDGGATWTDTGLGPWVSVLAIDPADPNTLYAATSTWFYHPGFGGLFKSTDAGAHWSSIGDGLEALIHTGAPITALAMDPVNPDVVYAGTSGNGVFRSPDGGADWTPFNDGLTNLDVQVLVIPPERPDMLYASTSGGIFTISTGMTTFTQ
jgi:photosystem II stability/assembly factor-like uncharacterized protein